MASRSSNSYHVDINQSSDRHAAGSNPATLTYHSARTDARDGLHRPHIGHCGAICIT